MNLVAGMCVLHGYANARLGELTPFYRKQCFGASCHWLSRNKNTHIREVYRALIDNTRALNNGPLFVLALHYLP